MRNPVLAWTEGKGTAGSRFFDYDGRTFRSTFDGSPEERRRFQELVREIADWRLGEHLDRSAAPVAQDDIVCKVATPADGRSCFYRAARAIPAFLRAALPSPPTEPPTRRPSRRSRST